MYAKLCICRAGHQLQPLFEFLNPHDRVGFRPHVKHFGLPCKGDDLATGIVQCLGIHFIVRDNLVGSAKQLFFVDVDALQDGFIYVLNVINHRSTPKLQVAGNVLLINQVPTSRYVILDLLAQLDSFAVAQGFAVLVQFCLGFAVNRFAFLVRADANLRAGFEVFVASRFALLVTMPIELLDVVKKQIAAPPHLAYITIVIAEGRLDDGIPLQTAVARCGVGRGTGDVIVAVICAEVVIFFVKSRLVL